MKSKTIKVLHPIAGVPIIRYVISTAAACRPTYLVIVVGRDGQQVKDIVGDSAIIVEQGELLGTGHALLQARQVLEGRADTILCLYGDMPLIRPETARRLIEAHHAAHSAMTLLTVSGDDSMGFGRIVRDGEGRVQAIVEETVASPTELAIKEYNAGVYCFDGNWLWPRLANLPVSQSGEYYLTDMLAVAVREGATVQTIPCDDPSEVLGINNRVHLAQAEHIMRSRINQALMLAGVTLLDPSSTYIDATVAIAPDTVIYPNTIIQGVTQIGEDCRIGPNSHIIDSTIGQGCWIWASVLEQATVGDGVRIGPYSHLRPGAKIGRQAYIGNFAEIKNSSLGEHVHMGHFSYLGDATVGREVNIGAGTITCNFDGQKKNPTIIEDGAFVGSDTLLVAPVKIGKRARTGAGSVVTHDVPDDTLVYGVPARIARKV